MDPKVEQLLSAVKAGDKEQVSSLLTESPELRNARTETEVSALLVAVYHGKPEIARLFVAPGRALDIFEATALGELERVRELAAEMNTTSPDGFQPLGLACFFGQE